MFLGRTRVSKTAAYAISRAQIPAYEMHLSNSLTNANETHRHFVIAMHVIASVPILPFKQSKCWNIHLQIGRYAANFTLSIPSRVAQPTRNRTKSKWSGQRKTILTDRRDPNWNWHLYVHYAHLKVMNFCQYSLVSLFFPFIVVFFFARVGPSENISLMKIDAVIMEINFN